MTPEMIAILAVGASLTGVNIALGGFIWQSYRALRTDLSTGLREAREDRDRLRAELSADLAAGLREAKEDRDKLRAELSAGLREAKEDRERLRADLSGRMDRIEGRMRDQGAHLVGIEGVLRDQGERIARIEGMLHLHLGRNADIQTPTVAAE